MGSESIDESVTAESVDELGKIGPIKSSVDEYIVKDYLAAFIDKPEKGEAHVVVTNKRAIIYFWTRKVALVNEAQITEITSTDIFWDKRNRRGLGAFLLVIGILGLALLIFGGAPIYFVPIGALLFIAIIFGIYLLVKESVIFGVILYVKSVTDAISLHNYPTGAVNKLIRPAQLRLEGKPGPDAEELAKEIGAYILDIQQGSKKK